MAWAKPRGTYIISRLSAVRSRPNHLLNVGEFRAQIDDRVPEGAAHAAHHLDLGRRRQLIVQPAQRALPRAQRIVDLDEAGLETVGGKLALAEIAGEEPAVVASLFEIDHAGSIKRRVVKLHRRHFRR